MTQPDDFALATTQPYAIYLPAIGESYIQFMSQAVAPSRLPATLTVEDLKFWTGRSALWNQKFFLHSMGNGRFSCRRKTSKPQYPARMLIKYISFTTVDVSIIPNYVVGGI